MNSKTLNLSKGKLSGWLLVLFFLLVVLTSLYSELFQAPLQEFDAKKLASNPLKTELLEGIKSLNVSNNQGAYQLDRDPDAQDFNDDGLEDETQDVAWTLVTPFTNAAKPAVIEQIFDLLKKINPKNAFQYEPINLSNFALDKPHLILMLKTEKGRETRVSFGLENEETKSSYIAIENIESKMIYVLPPLTQNLSTITLGNILDSKVFLGHNNNLEIVEIYKGKDLDKDPLVVILKKDQIWYGPNYEAANNGRVNDFLAKLFAIKSLMILDKLSDEASLELEKMRLDPEETIVLKNKSNSGVAYTISKPTADIPGIRFDRKSVVIWVSNRPHPYLVGKESLNSLATKQSYFDD